MRILVIGGSGFIGRFLVPRLLAEGHDVSVLQRPDSAATLPGGARGVRADRRRLSQSTQTLRALEPDVVVDLILSSGGQAREMMDVFRGHAGRVVVATSMDVYRAVGVLHGLEEGPLEPLPITEASALRTKLQTYPPAQIAMLKQIFSWVDDDYDKIPVEEAVAADPELPATILRLPMIYGPGDRLNRLWPIVKRVDDGRRFIVLPDSLGRWRGTRGYVENVASAIALAATSSRAAGQTYNVGELVPQKEAVWVLRVGAAAGANLRVALVPDTAAPPSTQMPGNLAQHWVVDTSRIRHELGYVEDVDWDEGIRRTVEWQRANPGPVDPRRFDYAAEDAAVSPEGLDHLSS